MLRGYNKMNEIILEWNATVMQREGSGEMVEGMSIQKYNFKVIFLY